MDLVKLAKVLGYTTSANDNEVLSAIRIANGILAESDITWDDFVSQKTIVIQEIVPKTNTLPTTSTSKSLDPEISKKLNACLENVRSASGLDFIRSLNRQYTERGSLSIRQLEALDKFYQNC